MKLFKDLLEETKEANTIQEKTALLSVCVNVVTKSKQHFSIAERKEIYDFAFNEIKPLEKQIENAKNYEEKDDIFAYADKLLSLILYSDCAGPESAQTLMSLLECVNKHRVLENAIDEMFLKQKITESDVKTILEKAAETTDDYEKGKLYSGLMHYENKFDNLEQPAKDLIVKFLNKETLESVLNFENLNKNQKYNLEVLCDLLRLYFNKDTVRILKTAEKIDNPAVAFYSADSLMELDENPSQSTIDFLANDIVYACLIHDSLERNGLVEMFPKNLDNPEYIAKSDMIHWLCYPTELGEKPTEIELLGKMKKHKKEYFVFKYKTTSSKIPEEKHNVWLVGWSAGDATFSDFELLSDYEKKTPEKTLKYISKKCF